MIKIENLSFTYNEEGKRVLQGINICVEKGDFVVLCGASGSGKTTLLRLMKRELSPKGKMEGSILIKGKNITSLSEREAAATVGFVFQNPENQIVTDKVWHELVFGMENLGMSQGDMKKRLAEITSFFNLGEILERNTWELSGGEKQKINLASIMAMKPEIILLDEPLSQLDPVAAQDFVNVLRKVNRELGTTIIMAEHDLRDVLGLADKIGIIESGKLTLYGEVNHVLNRELSKMNSVMNFMPVPVRLYGQLKNVDKCPVDVCGAKKMLDDYMTEFSVHQSINFEVKKQRVKEKPAFIMKNIYFRYSGGLKDILAGLNLKIYPGEICSIIGNNGSGKTTMLKVAAGILRSSSGKIKTMANHRVYLPQNPQTLFVKSYLLEDLEETAIRKGDIVKLAEKMEMEELLNRHPYDLSGGEQQRAALMKVLLKSPDMIFMDEPTKGVDIMGKRKIGEILRSLKEKGITILMATHDIEFAAEYSDRCGMLFNHEIAVSGETRAVLANNDFYTTETNRIASGYFENVLTFGELQEVLPKKEKR